MSPHAFLQKWRHIELKERSASQSHFNDISALLGLEDPITADPKGEWFTFEKGASKTGGGEGWADVWRRGAFAWEYKGRKANLDKAFAQLQQYAVALENPPLLIVSDMETIRIHTNFTNTVQEIHTIPIEDLADAAVRDRLRRAFLEPETFRPARTRQMLTEEVAQEFATLAHTLRARGHDSHTVAHFVNRLVFCLFAEDVGLLPNHMFKRMLEAGLADPPAFAGHAATLFAAMQSGGMVGFERVEWFNGGLFDTADALPLEKADIAGLLKAARLDWSEIDPSILGTLFERGLDPDKRSQLGAHYTDRDKIMLIVGPVIVEPLMAEWADAKAKIEAFLAAAPKATAEKLLRGKELAAATKARSDAALIRSAFLDRLANFRVLDPACGSGNFLYLSLLALKDIEHLVNIEAEALGLPREFPRIGPECVLGIELNPYAAELARVSVWIGEIQWMRRNGFEASRNPILKPLATIENRDAVLNADGTQADWPTATVVVGNPPFLGDKKMVGELGSEYAAGLRAAWPDVRGGADLVTYWFAKAWAQMTSGQLERAGLVATNSIRGGANRAVLKPIAEQGHIFEAWSDQPWTVDGAAVRVSMVCFAAKPMATTRLDGRTASRIHSDLTAGTVDLTLASRLPENRGRSFVGIQKTGDFNVAGDAARTMLRAPLNPNGRPNSDVLNPYWNGIDLTRRPQDIWLIDFPLEFDEATASMYEGPFHHLEREVRPDRSTNKIAWLRDNWWLLWRARPDMRAAVSDFSRFIVTPEVSKHRVFAWMPKPRLPDKNLMVIARDDDTSFGILHSRFHELWALRMGTFLGVGNDPRYTPSTTFETFPFPEGLTPNIPAADYAADPRAIAIADAARRLNELRENWLNPADLVRREPEVVPGYPDRILPVSEGAAKELAKRTLTNLYNQRPAWLDHAHKTLDEAVAAAYGWAEDWRAGLLTDDEILARLFALNQQHALRMC
jgi:type II restriction/modification system DNA methylase subunit YeeA